MNHLIIDTHAHTYFGHFDKDRDQIITRARQAGVESQIQIGCDEISSLAAIELARKEDNFYATIGIHPCDIAPFFEGNFNDHRIQGFEDYQRKAHSLDEMFELFEQMYAENKDVIVGVGETGFDRYHDNREELYKWQKESFRKHIAFSQKHDLPLVIHTRNSTQELLDFMETDFTEKNLNGVVHCFCEDIATARIITEQYGFYLGIGGIITYSGANGLREAVKNTPLKYLLSETDAPFLPPVKYKRKHTRNSSAALPEIITTIAEVKNIDVNEVAITLRENARTLFGV